MMGNTVYIAPTKEEFLKVYNAHPANVYTKFMYKYYSTNLKKKPTPIGSWLAIAGFIVATVGMILFDQLGNKSVAKTFCLGYILFGVWALTLPAFIMNHYRTGKVMKELGIASPEVYNNLVSQYVTE